MSSDEFFSPFADETCKRGFSRVENGTAGGGRRKENEEKEEGIPGHYRFLLSTSFQLVTEDLRLCIREHLVVARVFSEISIHSNRVPTRRRGIWECTVAIEKKLFLRTHPSTLYILFPRSFVTRDGKIKGNSRRSGTFDPLANNRCRNISTSFYFHLLLFFLESNSLLASRHLLNVINGGERLHRRFKNNRRISNDGGRSSSIPVEYPWNRNWISIAKCTKTGDSNNFCPSFCLTSLFRYRSYNQKKKLRSSRYVFPSRLLFLPFWTLCWRFLRDPIRNSGCKRNIHGTSVNDRVNRTSISGVKDSRKHCSTK